MQTKVVKFPAVENFRKLWIKLKLGSENYTDVRGKEK